MISAFVLICTAITFDSAARDFETPPQPNPFLVGINFGQKAFRQKSEHPYGRDKLREAWSMGWSDAATNPVKIAQADGFEDDEYFITPYSKNDPLYADLGQRLYRGEGSGENGNYLVNIPIDRYFGEVDSEGRLTSGNLRMREWAVLKLRVYDVDDDFQGSGREKQVDYIKINGHELKSRTTGARNTLSSGDDQYSIMTFDVPVEWLKFPEKPCFGEANCQPGVNRIEIEIDQANGGSKNWYVGVDWALLEIEGHPLRPTLILTGLGNTTATYTIDPLANYDYASYVMATHLGDKGIPNILVSSKNNDFSLTNESSFTNCPGNDCLRLSVANNIPLNRNTAAASWTIDAPWDSSKFLISEHAVTLEQIIKKLQERFGVKMLNIIAFGKAGIDAREYVRKDGNDAIDTLVQIEPPNHGLGFPFVPKEIFTAEGIEDYAELLKLKNTDCSRGLYRFSADASMKCEQYSGSTKARRELLPAKMRDFNFVEGETQLLEDEATGAGSVEMETRGTYYIPFTPKFGYSEEYTNIRVVVGNAWQLWAEDLAEKGRAANEEWGKFAKTAASEIISFAASQKLEDMAKTVVKWAGGSSTITITTPALQLKLKDPVAKVLVEPIMSCTGGVTYDFTGRCSPKAENEPFDIARSTLAFGFGLVAPELTLAVNTFVGVAKAGKQFFKATKASQEYHDTAAKSNNYGVSHQSATLPWVASCDSKVGVDSCSKDMENKVVHWVSPSFKAKDAKITWPTEEAISIDTMLTGAQDVMSYLSIEHRNAITEQLGTHWKNSGLSLFIPKNKALHAAKSLKAGRTSDAPKADEGQTASVGWGSYEPVFQNFAESQAAAEGHTFVLQENVPVVVTVFAPGEADATVVVTSPSGVEMPVANGASESFIGQLAIEPHEAGTWNVQVQGADAYSLRVGRARTNAVVSADASPTILAPGGETVLMARLHTPENAPAYTTLTMHATVQNPDGSLETVELINDGSGVFQGTYKPSVEDGKLLVRVTSVRDGAVQLMAEEPLELTVTPAAAAEILTLSAPKATKDKLGQYESVQYTVKAKVAQAGDYAISAAIGARNANGAHVTNLRSAIVTAEAPGEYEFTIDLDRNVVANYKDAFPFNFNSASLYYSNHGREELVASKAFNEPIPFDDASAFEELRVQFLGVQSKELKDTDGNGQNDQLQVTYRVALPTSGSYTLQASIGGADGEVVEWNHKNISGVGEQDVVLTYDVPRLKATGLTGFYLKDIGISAGPLPGSDPKVYPIAIENGTAVDAGAPRVAADEAPLVVDMDTLDGHALPDLQIRAATGGAADSALTFSGAETPSAILTIYNAGGEAAENVAWQARIGGANGTLLSEGTIENIGAGESAAIVIDGDAQTLQGQRVYVTVNPRHSVKEANYANNIAILDAVMDSVDPNIPTGLHAITLPAVEGGTVECTPNPVPDGRDATCTITPAGGYYLASLAMLPEDAAALACGAGQPHCSCMATSCTFTDEDEGVKSLLKAEPADEMHAKAQPAQTTVQLVGVKKNVTVTPVFTKRGGAGGDGANVAPVPTLGEWALMALAMLLTGFAFHNRQRWER